jgi:hypothetical protein
VRFDCNTRSLLVTTELRPPGHDCLVGATSRDPLPAPDGALCNDSDACTTFDHCLQGACRGTPIDCGGGPCQTAGACDHQSLGRRVRSGALECARTARSAEDLSHRCLR